MTITLTEGTRFDTEFETGCIVSREPGYEPAQPNAFLGLDSEGVECQYVVEMVTVTWCRAHYPLLLDGEAVYCTLPTHEGDHEEVREELGMTRSFPDQPECYLGLEPVKHDPECECLDGGCAQRLFARTQEEERIAHWYGDIK